MQSPIGPPGAQPLSIEVADPMPSVSRYGPPEEYRKRKVALISGESCDLDSRMRAAREQWLLFEGAAERRLVARFAVLTLLQVYLDRMGERTEYGPLEVF